MLAIEFFAGVYIVSGITGGRSCRYLVPSLLSAMGWQGDVLLGEISTGLVSNRY